MSTFIKNKRGDADTWVTVGKWSYYIIIIFFTSLAIILYAGKSFTFVQSKAVTPVNLEADLLIAQLVNSCFVYEEITGPLEGRIYQNVLDARKLTENMLRSCTQKSVSVTISSIDDSFEPYSLRTDRKTLTNIFSQLVLVKQGDELHPARMTVIL